MTTTTQNHSHWSRRGLAGLLAIAALGSNAYAGAVFEDNFDADTVGLIAPDWVYTAGAPSATLSTTVVVDPIAPSTSQALEHYNSNNAIYEISRAFSSVTLGNYSAQSPIYVGFDLSVIDIPLGDTTGNRGFLFYIGGLNFASLRFFSETGDDTQWQIFDPIHGAFNIANNLNLDQYYHFVLKISPDATPGTGAYEWYLDGVSVIASTYTASTQLNALHFVSVLGTGDVTDTSTIFRLDNVAVYVPEPASAALLALGLACVGLRRRNLQKQS